MTSTFAARMDDLSAEMLLTQDTLARVLVEVEREITAECISDVTATDAAAVAVQEACDRLRGEEG